MAHVSIHHPFLLGCLSLACMFTFGMTAEAQSTCTHYASPNGTGNGLSLSTPFQISKFWSLATPGKTLCLLDGTYSDGNSSIVVPETFAGTSSQPITIRALNDGKVTIQGAMRVWTRGSWGVLEGINVLATGTSEFVVGFGGDHWTMRRVVALSNTGDITAITSWATNSVMEDMAAIGLARKIVTVGADGGGQFSTTILRRLFILHTGRRSSGSPYESLEVGYGQNAITVENAIVTRDTDPGANTDTNEAPILAFQTVNSKILGSISYAPASAAFLGNQMVTMYSHGAGTPNLVLRDIVGFLEPGNPSFNGARPFTLTGDSRDTTMVAQNLVGVGGAASTCDVSGWGSSCGNIRSGTSLAAAIGAGKSIWNEVPGICKRYVDGTLTDQPLWPWPMNQRIKDALVQAGRTPVDVTQTMESLLGPIPAECKGSGSSTPSPTPTPVLPPGSICSKIDQAYSLPTGFGSPYNFFTNPISRFLDAYCDYANTTNSIVTAFVQKPSSIQYHYTYTQGYQWNTTANQWEPFTFTCDAPLINGVWCTGNAKKQLNYAQPYFIAYSCSWINSQWKCGCRDNLCTAGYWQLQRFQ
jgi:hypothetical protein